MKRGQTYFRRIALLVALLAVVGMASGCRYAQNRTYDFCDMIQLGVGVTSENPNTGLLPPAFGLYGQVTEYVNFGAMWFSGYVAEWDGRGFFAGHEDRIRLGFLPFQYLKLDQNYAMGSENYFKKKEAMWTNRMNTRRMRWCDAPAKELEYEYWSDQLHLGVPILYRGWQYWENIAFEAAIGCPCTSHLGFMIRAGFDISEVSDFILGFVMIDFKRDDMTPDEFREKTGRKNGEAKVTPEAKVTTEPKPASDAEKTEKK